MRQSGSEQGGSQAGYQAGRRSSSQAVRRLDSQAGSQAVKQSGSQAVRQAVRRSSSQALSHFLAFYFWSVFMLPRLEIRVRGCPTTPPQEMAPWHTPSEKYFRPSVPSVSSISRLGVRSLTVLARADVEVRALWASPPPGP